MTRRGLVPNSDFVTPRASNEWKRGSFVIRAAQIGSLLVSQMSCTQSKDNSVVHFLLLAFLKANIYNRLVIRLTTTSFSSLSLTYTFNAFVLEIVLSQFLYESQPINFFCYLSSPHKIIVSLQLIILALSWVVFFKLARAGPSPMQLRRPPGAHDGGGP